MLRVIFGEKGTGKTKRIIDTANATIDKAKGTVVYIDRKKDYSSEIKHTIRFVDISEYGIDGSSMFYGFICGLVAQDFDLEAIFIDGFLKIVKISLNELEELITKFVAFSKKFNVDITVSISGDAASTPEFIKPYIV